MMKVINHNRNRCGKSEARFTVLEFEGLLVLMKLGYSKDRLEPTLQKHLEEKINALSIKILGRPNWQEHIEDLVTVHGSTKNIKI